MKNTIYQIAQKIARNEENKTKEKHSIIKNDSCYSIYKSHGGWVGSIDKNMNSIQGVCKKYRIEWDENLGWEITGVQY